MSEITFKTRLVRGTFGAPSLSWKFREDKTFRVDEEVEVTVRSTGKKASRGAATRMMKYGYFGTKYNGDKHGQ